ncbi:hypothetical protein LCGC14_1580230 [marine sediment metagenome]|uniref:Glycosyl transferase family 25 domain-containing protein n=1 Tax=marine sediment metagenome TaxID=412755 RepID=A0A0F9J374_9ZZZZ
MDIHLNNLKVFCINLDDRPDRWAEVQEEVKKIGITIERFPAIKHKRGHTGCILSHIEVWKMAKSLGVWMTIEDDILFLSHPKQNLEKAIKQLPDDWDMLYLGATLNQPLKQVSKNLLRLQRGWTTHGIIYNNQNGVVDFILNGMSDFKVDVFLTDYVQPKFNCFMCYPMVATQRPGHSDILNHYVSYKPITDRYKRYVTDIFEQD